MNLVTESWWQRGFNDGYANLVPAGIRKPGYSNGYMAGRAKRMDEEVPRCPTCKRPLD